VTRVLGSFNRAALLLALAPAAAVRGDAIDDYVTARMAAEHVPGLSLAVVRDGRVVRARGYGLANVELQVKATPETIYQSGSVGKQFTATAVMMLVEAGKLGLDDPISRYFPEAPTAWAPIRVRHLLTHTSGLKDYDLPLWHEYTQGDLLRAFAEPPLEFAPGDSWSYSNTGYVLLGFLIERVTGRFYGDLLAERVFEPLGMDATRVISEADIVPNRAAGYRLLDGVLKNQEWVAPSLNRTADGSLYFSVLDVAKWDAALYTERLLKRASLEAMWTPARLKDGRLAEGYDDNAYGSGWAVGEQRGHRRIEHGGSWQGFKAQISRYVDDRLSVIVLLNLASGNPHSIAHGVAGLEEAALRPPAMLPVVADPEPAREAGLRAFATSSDAKEAARLEGKRLGFLACDDVRGRGFERAGKSAASLCYYRLSGEKETRTYKFWLEADGSPAGVFSEAD
jgi:CubicO group peptidase (beta-lactamase class C family)